MPTKAPTAQTTTQATPTQAAPTYALPSRTTKDEGWYLDKGIEASR